MNKITDEDIAALELFNNYMLVTGSKLSLPYLETTAKLIEHYDQTRDLQFMPANELQLVPKNELQKLEAARIRLYEYLETILNEDQMINVVNITGQIWKVANTKRWPLPPANRSRTDE